MIQLTHESAQQVLNALHPCNEASKIMQAAIDAPPPSGEREALIAWHRAMQEVCRDSDGTAFLNHRDTADMLAADAQQDAVVWHCWFCGEECTSAAAPQPPQADAPEQEPIDTKCQPNGIAHMIPPITLNGHELHNALRLVGGDPDDLKTTISIQYKQDGKDTDGEDAPAGYYAWIDAYPEEGSIRLDEDKSDAVPPAPQARELTDDEIMAALGRAIDVTDAV